MLLIGFGYVTDLSGYIELVFSVSTSSLAGIVTIWPADKFVQVHEICSLDIVVKVQRRGDIQSR
jgi:hypothetical protein